MTTIMVGVTVIMVLLAMLLITVSALACLLTAVACLKIADTFGVLRTRLRHLYGHSGHGNHRSTSTLPKRYSTPSEAVLACFKGIPNGMPNGIPNRISNRISYRVPNSWVPTIVHNPYNV